MGNAPCVLPCPETLEHQSTCVDLWVHRVPKNGHQPLGRCNSLWRSACTILWSNPILKRYFMDIIPVYPLALRLRNTKVHVWIHESIGYPKMDISHWDAAINYGVQLAQYCDQTRSCNVTLWISPFVYSLALRLKNTKVPVWTHESIGYPKMDISHWDAAIHFGVQFGQFCDQTRSCNSTWCISPPCVLPCPKTQEHQSTCMDSWVHRVPVNGLQLLGRGNLLWRSACPILWTNPIFQLCFMDIAPVYSLALRLWNTKVPVWTYESIGYPKMDISHWDAAIHYGVQLAQYCDQIRSCNATLRRSPLVYSLALRLRNTKVPVWTHESIGYPKTDISHWDAAIHYGVQLVQYCDQTRFVKQLYAYRPLCTPLP